MKRASTLYVTLVVAGALACIILGVGPGDWSHIHASSVVFWLVACAASNLLPVPLTRGVEVTMCAPVDIAIAYIFPPPVAAALVALGSVTEWELRGKAIFSHAISNRAQLALSAATASWLFQHHGLDPWRILVAILGYNLVNLVLALTGQRLWHETPVRELFRRIVSPVPSFIGSYLVLGYLGITFAKVYRAPGLGWWAVAPFLVPLLFARYALRHSKQLEQAEREKGALATRLIDERERERARIASDMHDLVLQRLAAVQIQADNITSALRAGFAEQASSLAVTVKGEVAGAIGDIRTAIADLRRAAVDGSDLGTTLDRYARAFRVETAIDVAIDVDGLQPGDLPLPVALLLYECAQEAMTNVVRHAGASHIDLTLHRLGDSVELKVRDNGRGPSTNGQTGVHLGLNLTKDKVALVGGGAWFEGLEGGGAQVVVRIPVRTSS